MTHQRCLETSGIRRYNSKQHKSQRVTDDVVGNVHRKLLQRSKSVLNNNESTKKNELVVGRNLLQRA